MDLAVLKREEVGTLPWRISEFWRKGGRVKKRAMDLKLLKPRSRLN